ncbi:hypothetical protein F6B41_12300 [Microbacterium lushaniae]|nr:hypothetical protein F6B41_12300 [Microbacterium lushaniae]
MRGAAAWANLQAALTTADPACRDDPRFTADDVSSAELRPICDGCAVREMCAEYARVAPRGAIYGVWAGLVRRTPRQHRDPTLPTR